MTPDEMIDIDKYLSLRLILWSYPHWGTISRKDAHSHFGAQWEYVYPRSLEDHEIELINELIAKFGPIEPRYRTFHIYGNRLPYTYGHPIYQLGPIKTPKTIKLYQYPQLQESASGGEDVKEMEVSEVFLWYSEHWYDMDLNRMSESEKDLINNLIFEFGPIIPSLTPDADKPGWPIISV